MRAVRLAGRSLISAALIVAVAHGVGVGSSAAGKGGTHALPGGASLVRAATPALPTVAVEGPSNSLWVYWQTADAQWHGPLEAGGPGSTYATPSVAIGANGLPTIAVQGPGNALWVYWQAADANWYGPLGVGGSGTTFAAPSVSIGANGLPTVAVQGPGNMLWVYWQAANANWYGPLGVGGIGTTFGAPSLAVGANGLPTVAVHGPGNMLWVYWQAANANWYGPLGVGGDGSTFASPSLAIGANGLPTVSVQGPGNTLWVYWQAANADWYGPLGVGGQGSTPAAPSTVESPGGLPTVADTQSNGALWVYWQTSDAQWHGPLGVGGQSSVNVPAGSPYFSFSVNMTEGGSGTGYSSYIGVHDPYNDALSVGIQSDSTAPPGNGAPYYIWELVQNGNFTFGYLNPAGAGSAPITLAWWSGANTAVFYEGSTPVADISASFTPRLGFSIEGDARQNGDSVNDVFTNTQIKVGNNCPSSCGLLGTWNSSSYNYYGLMAHQTNNAAQNGANFTVTGTASGVPPGGNWGNALIAGMADISQLWNGN